jgi:uncharacterized protein (DUF2267 family)
MHRVVFASAATAAATILFHTARQLRQPGTRARLRYQLSGRQPDPNVDDHTLADRIRSTIGPLEKSLDIPRVHVAVANHAVTLHGDVADTDQAHTVEQVVGHVAGVRRVDSHLHTRLLPGDTRPSSSRREALPTSPAKRRLLAAANRGGADDAEAAVRATLAVLCGRLPRAERLHLLGHLPADVRKMMFPVPYADEHTSCLRSVEQFIAAVRDEGLSPVSLAEPIAAEVLAEMQRLVPEEVDDVAAALPRELNLLWTQARPR